MCLHQGMTHDAVAVVSKAVVIEALQVNPSQGGVILHAAGGDARWQTTDEEERSAMLSAVAGVAQS